MVGGVAKAIEENYFQTKGSAFLGPGRQRHVAQLTAALTPATLFASTSGGQETATFPVEPTQAAQDNTRSASFFTVSAPN